MQFRTHLALAFLFGLFYLELIGYSLAEGGLILLLFLFGALLPDIDHFSSWLNNKLKITKILALFLQPRGMMHSLFFAVLIFFIIGLFWEFSYATAILLGYLSHLLGDLLTKDGLRLFQPFGQLNISGFFRTGKLFEKFIFILLMVLIVLKLFP
ncbi:metal-dependent hydrolase [Candidatus Woesearchaeota archaeon]|nr:metal-dependent hydrolase [Candidatus Woesearchaeota archaeon]